MKTLTILALILFPACMSDRIDDPTLTALNADASHGQDGSVSRRGPDVNQVTEADAATSTDAKGDATATDGQDTGIKTIPCDIPAKERLKNNDDGTWHDSLLDIDCTFVKTDGHGKRCLPIWTHQLGQGFGNSDFPGASPSAVWLSADCKANQGFVANPNGQGKTAKYGFNMLSADTVKDAVNLMDPPEDTIVSKDPVIGKANSLKETYGGKPCKKNKGDWSVIGTDYQFLMVANGVASIPHCHFLTGFDLFAELPKG